MKVYMYTLIKVRQYNKVNYGSHKWPHAFFLKMSFVLTQSKVQTKKKGEIKKETLKDAREIPKQKSKKQANTQTEASRYIVTSLSTSSLSRK